MSALLVLGCSFLLLKLLHRGCGFLSGLNAALPQPKDVAIDRLQGRIAKRALAEAWRSRGLFIEGFGGVHWDSLSFPKIF